MKIITLLVFVLSVFFNTALIAGDTYVQGYYRSDGTYVSPHYRSAPDSSYNNNWSVQGNQNPYTGEYGTGSPTLNDRTPSYNRKNYGAPLYDNNGGSSGYGSGGFGSGTDSYGTGGSLYDSYDNY